MPVTKAPLPADLQAASEVIQQDYWQLQTLFINGGLLVLGTVALERPFGRLRAGGPFVMYDRHHRGVVIGAQSQSPLVFELVQRLVRYRGQVTLADLLASLRVETDQWTTVNNDLRLLATAEWIR